MVTVGFQMLRKEYFNNPFLGNVGACLSHSSGYERGDQIEDCVATNVESLSNEI
jgi:hypothetical protein